MLFLLILKVINMQGEVNRIARSEKGGGDQLLF